MVHVDFNRKIFSVFNPITYALFISEGISAVGFLLLASFSVNYVARL